VNSPSETTEGREDMSNWKKFLIAAAALLMLGAGATMVAQAAGSNGAPGAVDISGPCDEAEHTDDPRCAGVTVPAGGGDDLRFDFDISGPCDEAEHANDPRCAGVGGIEDNSGPGSGNDDREDNSGPSENSGPGNAHEDEDNSGPGDGDHDDDNSGPGDGDN
jgi:hypothetical protein